MIICRFASPRPLPPSLLAKETGVGAQEEVEMKRMRVSHCANIAFHPEPGDGPMNTGPSPTGAINYGSAASYTRT